MLPPVRLQYRRFIHPHDARPVQEAFVLRVAAPLERGSGLLLVISYAQPPLLRVVWEPYPPPPGAALVSLLSTALVPCGLSYPLVGCPLVGLPFFVQGVLLGFPYGWVVPAFPSWYELCWYVAVVSPLPVSRTPSGASWVA